MKKKVLIIGGIIAVAGIGYWLYKRSKQPNAIANDPNRKTISGLETVTTAENIPTSKRFRNRNRNRLQVNIGDLSNQTLTDPNA